LTANIAAYGNTLYHCTIDNCTQLITSSSSGADFTFINSVLANVTTLKTGSTDAYGHHNGFYHCPRFGTSQFPPSVNDEVQPFQTADYGNHYLSDASGFRAVGSTAIPSALLTALKTKSTRPPVSFPVYMEVTGELTLFPQVPRYVSGAPDLGYYYDALDYTVAEMTVYDGGTVTVQPGTAIGLRTDYDLELQWRSFSGFNTFEGATIVSRGTPNAPHHLRGQSAGAGGLVFGARRVFLQSLVLFER